MYYCDLFFACLNQCFTMKVVGMYNLLFVVNTLSAVAVIHQAIQRA